MNQYENCPSYYLGYRRDMAPLLPIYAKTILEVGGGDGGFRINFPPEAEYWLIEPVALAAHQAVGSVTRILIGTSDEVCEQVPNQYFDLIICNDVIEHMPDWKNFLVSIQEKLKDSSSLLIGSIPNVRHFANLYNLIFRKDWEYADQGILDRTHVAFFTVKSLRRELSTANLKIHSLDLMKRFA